MTSPRLPRTSDRSPDRARGHRKTAASTILPLLPLGAGACAAAILSPPETPAGVVLLVVAILALLALSVVLQIRLARPPAEPETGASREAERARSELLAIVGHELRTPLGVILGMTELAGQTSLTREQREYVEAAHRSARQLRGLVDDLLDLSQIEGGTLHLHERAYSLPTLVSDIVGSFLPVARQKGIDLVSDASPEVPDGVRGDPARLRQVLSALVDNALKVTEEGRVAVSLRPVGPGRIGLRVSDTGRGIAPEDRGRLFEPLPGGHPSRGPAGGAGLGLALCARLVSLMGGEIQVESELGQGSTFSFEIDAPTDPAGNAANEGDLAALKDQRVLVLDGDPESRRILGELLESLGIVPMLTQDPALARDALSQAAFEGRPFAVLIVDLRLRGSVSFRAQRGEDDPLVAATPRIFLDSPGAGPYTGRTGGSPRLDRPITRPHLLQALGRALGDPSPHEGAPLPSSPEDSLRVLVAEDNPLNAFMAVRMLERLGHAADRVADGAQALEALGGRDYDVVLMDVQMPGTDGLEATRTIRKRERTSGRHLRVVAVTAFGATGEPARCRAAGMDDVLPKPFSISALAAALHAGRGEDEGETPASGEGDPPRVEGPVLDIPRLEAQLGGDREAAAEVLRAFLRDAPPTLDELEQAVGGQDRQAVARIAHRLKGTLRWIHAAPAGAVAEALESEARSSRSADLNPPLLRLRRELEQVIAEASGGLSPVD